MPYEFEYSVEIQKYNNGFKLHYVIPKKYFDGADETFENFVTKISAKKDDKDFSIYKEIINENEIIEKLKQMNCTKLNNESYFMTVKHHIIQEYKQFNRNYQQIKGIARRLNGNDMYSHIAIKYVNSKQCIEELIKAYKAELEFDYKNLVKFIDYNENNISKLHTDILSALTEHEKEYKGVCFDLINISKDEKLEDECIEDMVYYKFANKISTRIIKRENEKTEKVMPEAKTFKPMKYVNEERKNEGRRNIRNIRNLRNIRNTRNNGRYIRNIRNTRNNGRYNK
jgi:hypothetical protein